MSFQSAQSTPNRPTQGVGRTHINTTFTTAQTADASLYTVTANKTLYVTTLHISAFNTSTSSNGLLAVLDGSGGTAKIVFLMSPSGVAAQLAASAAVSVVINMAEPMRFTTGVYTDMTAGTLTWIAGIVGYEEVNT